MENKKVLLSIDNLEVQFRMRGRTLTAIRGISLDIFENESIAIVGESGSGKSVFTKTFVGMLDSNGYISNGKIIFNDDELSDTNVHINSLSRLMINYIFKRLNSYSVRETHQKITKETEKRNDILAKEIYLSVGRYGFRKRVQLIHGLIKAFKKAMQLGIDIMDEEQRNAIFDTVAFRVRYLDETPDNLHGTCVINLANVKYYKDWSQIRGGKIATVFQDPMTSLNPIITIGKQITSVIMKHQDCTASEARHRALELMNKVGIPNAEKRFDDYPFQYSGGMRQRIVIAIALSCQPKILICDEPTTALDVTIQAQILQLIKDLQKEFNYTTVFITHDLGVVANIADRVAVLYAGQIVELGTVEEIFYEPKHPYTWALLSSLPQLAQRNSELYSITGTPPSLYNNIVGDAFAPRNPYCLKIDTLAEPPMFKVSDTHYAKTWLLDSHAPEIEKPEIIQDIHSKLIKAFNI